MLLLFIITSILYLILTYLVLSLYYRYRKDIEEIENRLLQFEKRVVKGDKDCEIGYIYHDEQINEIFTILKSELKIKNIKEVSDMACRKGRGGRKK